MYVRRSIAVGPATWMMIVLVVVKFSTSSVVANFDYNANRSISINRASRVAYPANVTLEMINQRISVVLATELRTQKKITDLEQQFSEFKTNPPAQTDLNDEYIKEQFQSINTKLDEIVEHHQAQTANTELVSIVISVQKAVEENVREMQRVLNKLNELTVLSEDIQRQLADDKSQLMQAVTSSAVDNMTKHQTPTESVVPIRCDRVPEQKTGFYRIKTTAESEKPFNALCSKQDAGDMWTVILNRNEDTTNFYRGWTEYKNGFGNVGNTNHSFWIGLDKIHELTSSIVHQLLVTLEDFNGNVRQATYSSFGVAREDQGYELEFLGTYDGNAGDSLSYHAGSKFSTFDVDNDKWLAGSCAMSHFGGWWYNECDKANLCGVYLGGEVPPMSQYQGVYWNDFHGSTYSLKRVQMMIRPAPSYFTDTSKWVKIS